MFGLTKSVVAIVSLVSVSAQPVLAQEHKTPNAQSAEIDVSKIDLSSDRNWNRVADAIRTKASEICNRDMGASDQREADVEECTQTSYDHGVEQMRSIYARRQAANVTRLARS